LNSPFQNILRSATARAPNAVGCAFAAWDGEIVDYVTTWDNNEWLVLTAHYGIVLSHVQSALHTFHFGEANTLCLTHSRLDIIVEAVSEGYFALLALGKGGNLGKATAALREAAAALRKEMA